MKKRYTTKEDKHHVPRCEEKFEQPHSNQMTSYVNMDFLHETRLGVALKNVGVVINPDKSRCRELHNG
jgi:hypothetical protein